MTARAKVTQIAIAVVEHRGMFLVGQRPAGVALAGLWEFPGGKMLPAESPEEAAVRECLEETGLVVLPRFRYSEQVQEYAHGVVQLYFIGCELIGPVAVAREPFRWVERHNLAEYEFPAGNRTLLDELGGRGSCRAADA